MTSRAMATGMVAHGCGAAIALCLFSCVNPAPTALDAKKVRLRFDWGNGLVARATATRTQHYEGLDVPDASSTLHSTLRASRRGRRWLLVHEDASAASPATSTPADAAAPDWPRSGLGGSFSLPLPYLVRSNGEFVGVQDVDALMRVARGLVERQLATGTPEEQFQARLTSKLLSRDTFERSASNEWSAILGPWVGLELEIGTLYHGREAVRPPELGGTRIQVERSFLARRLLPCERAGRERVCVELVQRLTSSLDDAAHTLPSALLDVATEAEGARPTLPPAQLQLALELVTEPDGLIPHAYTWTATNRMQLPVEGHEELVESTFVERIHVEYAYEPEADAPRDPNDPASP